MTATADSRRNTVLATLIPVFAMIVAPLGVAGQNIGLGVAMASYLALNAFDSWMPLRRCLRDALVRQYILAWSVIVIPVTIATLRRGDLKEASRFFWGYLFVCSIPVFARTLITYKPNITLLAKLINGLLLVTGLVCLSQFIWAWKIENHQIVSTIRRAQGFYSHPLTLAYAVLPLIPWLTARFFANFRSLSFFVSWTSALVIVATSQSVTVIAVTIAIIVTLAMRILSSRQRAIAALTGVLTCGAIMITPNPISEKVTMVLSGTRSDHETGYPDDRMAFWHANFEMFMDAPFLGHGTGLGRDDRKPYFEKIGLGHLKRMYESHNMYLQYAVEGGIVAALALAGFLAWWYLSARQWSHGDPMRIFVLRVTAVAFALAGLTQNSIQDSEVRYLLVLTFAGLISRI
jgi:hypothetical protein